MICVLLYLVVGIIVVLTTYDLTELKFRFTPVGKIVFVTLGVLTWPIKILDLLLN